MLRPFAHHVAFCLVRVLGSCCTKFQTGETFARAYTCIGREDRPSMNNTTTERKERKNTFLSFISPFTGRNTRAQQTDQLPTVWLQSSVDRAMHPHRRGPGFESR